MAADQPGTTLCPANLELEGEELLSDVGCGIDGHERMIVWFSWREGLCIDIRSAETGNYSRMTLSPAQADQVADQLKKLAAWRREHP